jgi:hypothetical protein
VSRSVPMLNRVVVLHLTDQRSSALAPDVVARRAFTGMAHVPGDGGLPVRRAGVPVWPLGWATARPTLLNSGESRLTSRSDPQ